MAKARTTTELTGVWNFDLEVLNQDQVFDGIDAPTATVSVGCLGCTVALNNLSAEGNGGALLGPPREPGHSYPEWTGQYFPFQLRITTGMTYVEEYYVVWAFDYQVDPVMPQNLPEGAPVSERDLVIPVTITTSGIYAKGEVDDISPSDRPVLDFTDLYADYSWYAGEDSIVTIAAGGLSRDFNLGYSGEDIELGTSFNIGYHFVIHKFPVANVIYARIGDPKWDDDAINLDNCDLWYSSSPPSGNVPDATQPGWSREESDATIVKVHVFNSGGVAIRCDGVIPGVAVDQPWTGWTISPWLVTFVPVDGGFADDETYPGDDVTYVSNAVTWEYVGGVWVATAEKFGGELVADEWRSSWDFPHEWQRLMGKVLEVETDETWRDEMGEDVGGGLAPNNDRQCGLLLPAIDAGFEGAPWWGPFTTFQHEASIDVNDPPDVAERPSSWTGGTGVTVNPSDNDEWVVAAGQESPEVTRSFATRYWLRMDRLADHLDDEGTEHNADWPIMLKANLPIEVTEDDPDWWV